MKDETLLELVHARVRLIPPGQVMSYGQVGDEVGCSAREAGWAMNQAPDEGDVPWQRVVAATGICGSASGRRIWRSGSGNCWKRRA